MRNVAVSLVSPLGFLFGGGMVPTLIGVSGDLASFSLGIIIVGVLIAIGALLPGSLRYYDQSSPLSTGNGVSNDNPKVTTR